MERGRNETEQDMHVVKNFKEHLPGFKKKSYRRTQHHKENKCQRGEYTGTCIESREKCSNRMKNKNPDLFKGLGKLEKRI